MNWMPVRLKRTIPAVVLCLAAAGCGSNTAFRMNSANQTYAAINELYVVLAKADLGLIRSPGSFVETADSYAQIVAGFELGRMVPVGGRLSSDASRAASRDSLDAAIARCIAEVAALSDQHRRAGIEAGSDRIGTTRSACNAATRSVAANETASLFISTVAGDL